MTYVITQPSIGVKDKSCIDVCPMDCIHGTGQDNMLYIDPEDCIDCNGCVPVCPVNAIFLENEVPEKWKEYTQINADYFKGKEITPTPPHHPGFKLFQSFKPFKSSRKCRLKAEERFCGIIA